MEHDSNSELINWPNRVNHELIAIWPETYTDTTGTRSGGQGARKLTTLSKGIFPPYQSSCAIQVFHSGFRDGHRDDLNGVSDLVQIALLGPRARFDQPYGGLVSRGHPVSYLRSCQGNLVWRKGSARVYFCWRIRIGGSNYKEGSTVRRDITWPREQKHSGQLVRSNFRITSLFCMSIF